jgi:cell division septation protein DedD
MKDYDLEDTRAGTACTFTGRGSRDKAGRLVHAFTVSGFTAIFAFAVGAAYFMAQTSSRPALPPTGGPAVTNASMPGASAPSEGRSHPSSASEPAISSASPADQVGSGDPPQGSPRGHLGGGQQPLGRPLAASTGVYTHESTVSPSRFHVQSGSFVNRDNAVSLVMQLRGHGYAVTLTGGPLYRVWVGGDLDRTKAERLAANLQATGFDAALIPR